MVPRWRRFSPVGLAVGLGVFQAPFLRLLLGRVNRMTLVSTLLLVALAGVIIVQSLNLSVTFDRWHRLLTDPDGSSTIKSRWLVDQVCVKALPQAGISEFGPGTFSSIFPYYSRDVTGDLTGFWRYAHNDYLQTLMEWGLGGSFSWALVLWGGLVVLLGSWRQRRWRTVDQILGAGIGLSLIGIFLSSAIDFPLQIASIQLYTVVLVGLGWSSSAWPRVRR